MAERRRSRVTTVEQGQAPAKTPEALAREIMMSFGRENQPSTKPSTRPPEVLVGPIPKKKDAQPVHDRRANEVNKIDDRIRQVREKIAALEAQGSTAASQRQPVRKASSARPVLEGSPVRPERVRTDRKPVNADRSGAEQTDKLARKDAPSQGFIDKAKVIIKENPRKSMAAAALSVLMVPTVAGVYLNSAENDPGQSLAASGDGVLRLSGETGIAVAVNTTDGKLEVVPSEQIQLEAEIDSYAYMGAHVSPENFSNFVTIEGTDEPDVMKATVDRSAMVIDFWIPKKSNPEEVELAEKFEEENGLKDIFQANLLDPPKEGERLINDDRVSPEEEESIRRAVVRKEDEKGILSPHNQSYFGASKMAVVGSILNTDVCRDVVAEMHDKYDEQIREAYKWLGEKKGVTYELVFKDGTKYTSGTDKLIEVSKGGELSSTFRGEGADRAACDIKMEPKLTPENKEKFTGVPGDD